MGRAPCCDKANVKKGPWSPEEDTKLKEYIEKYGTGGNWIALPQKAGLRRCGKSCRLRWLNYLRPNIKHGQFSEEEDQIICTLYAKIGSRWSIIATQLPGRTDNDIKNYWNTKLKKKLLMAAAGTTSSSPMCVNVMGHPSSASSPPPPHHHLLLPPHPSPPRSHAGPSLSSSTSSSPSPPSLYGHYFNSTPAGHYYDQPITNVAVTDPALFLGNSTQEGFASDSSHQYGGGVSALDEMGSFDQSNSYCVNNSGLNMWGSATTSMGYGYEDIKQFISSGGTNYMCAGGDEDGSVNIISFDQHHYHHQLQDDQKRSVEGMVYL